MKPPLTKYLDGIIKLMMEYIDPTFNHPSSSYYIAGDSCLGASQLLNTPTVYECSLHITDGPNNMMDEHEWFSIEFKYYHDCVVIFLDNNGGFNKQCTIKHDDLNYQKLLKLKLAYT